MKRHYWMPWAYLQTCFEQTASEKCSLPLAYAWHGSPWVRKWPGVRGSGGSQGLWSCINMIVLEPRLLCRYLSFLPHQTAGTGCAVEVRSLPSAPRRSTDTRVLTPPPQL